MKVPYELTEVGYSMYASTVTEIEPFSKTRYPLLDRQSVTVIRQMIHSS